MTGSIIWKSLLTIAVVAWAVLNIIPPTDTPFEDYIDTQITAEVEEFEVLKSRAMERVESNREPSLFAALKNMMIEDSIDFQKFVPQIDGTDIKNRTKRNDVLLGELLSYSHGKVKLGLDLKGGIAFTFKVKETDLDDNVVVRQEQLSKAMEIIRKRVDSLGVAEPIIRLKGANRIEVQMPGISTKDNPDIIKTIGKPAKLEFCMVHRTARPNNTPDTPLGYVPMIEERENSRTGEVTEVPYYIKRPPAMTGEIIDQAFAAPNDFGGFRVNLRFTDEGSDTFGNVTGRIAQENQTSGTVGQMAIILDGKLYSAPTVQQAITGGGAEITGRFSQREALELANVLNNPLKVGLSVDEMYEVGPSLAEDARDASLNAFKIGAALVVLFMIIYYLSAGLIAVISVGINIVIVFGTLSSLGATVTLPGVAALVLTIGMAVDANILIFERIREELRVGKKLSTSLSAGYEKALSTIVDANVTTLITAGILIWLGTGPVKGFGVTLAIGIVASMFCALLVSRAMLEFVVNTGAVKKMMVKSFFKTTKVPFLNYRKYAFSCSWIVVLVGMSAVVANRDHIFGTDFTGGEELILKFEEKLTSQQVDKVASDNNLGEVNVVFQTTIGQGVEDLKITTQHDRGDEMLAALQTTFPDAGLDLIGKSTISASVGDEVKWSAVQSISLALVFILFYVAVRFEFGYGIGAVIATIHDILMSIGLFVLLGSLGFGSGQFSAPMVAAVLMIIGYSLNDTIVVFDRIREELTLNPSLKLEAVVNLAINCTLSRTLLTSVTTLLATTALYLWGAGVVIDFALVFIIGIFTGTFSSIFIASPVFFWYHKGERKHVEERHILPEYEWQTSSRKPSKSTN